jgi:hypothetical protein
MLLRRVPPASYGQWRWRGSRLGLKLLRRVPPASVGQWRLRGRSLEQKLSASCRLPRVGSGIGVAACLH